MELVLKMKKFVTFALHHTGDGNACPASHYVGDVVCRHLFLHHGFCTLAFMKFLFQGMDALFEFLEATVADFRHTSEVAFALSTLGIELQRLDNLFLLLYLLQQRTLALPLLFEGPFLIAQCMDFLVELCQFDGMSLLCGTVGSGLLLAANGLALDFKLPQTA